MEKLKENLYITLTILRKKEELHIYAASLVDMPSFFQTKFWTGISGIIAFLSIGLFSSLIDNFFFVIPGAFMVYLGLTFGLGILFSNIKSKKNDIKYQELRNRINYYEQLVKQNTMMPQAYLSSEVVAKCIFYLENKRADDLKEALNLYESERQLQLQTYQISELLQRTQKLEREIEQAKSDLEWNNMLTWMALTER